MFKSILLVGAGGAMGSILRYLTSLFIGKYIHTVFPAATFTANVLGCFLIGILLAYLEKQHLSSNNLKLLMVIGFCGGYTTFSTFTAENINLIQTGNTLQAIIYVTLSVFTCMLALWFGLTLSK